MHTIFGLTGTFASGKDTASEYLAKKLNYLHVSTGDLIRAATEQRGLSVHRDNLHVVANELRAAQGGDVFVKQALAQQQSTGAKGLIVSGLRNPKEVETLKQAGGYFIFTDAPVQQRYEWAKARGRLEDDTDLEGFKAQEAKELNNPDPSGQQIEVLRPLADIVVQNSGSLEDFYKQLDAIVEPG